MISSSYFVRQMQSGRNTSIDDKRREKTENFRGIYTKHACEMTSPPPKKTMTVLCTTRGAKATIVNKHLSLHDSEGLTRQQGCVYVGLFFVAGVFICGIPPAACVLDSTGAAWAVCMWGGSSIFAGLCRWLLTRLLAVVACVQNSIGAAWDVWGGSIFAGLYRL